MKTSKSRIALRALVASLFLLGAALQTNVAEASCTVSSGGITVKCSGEEGTCRADGIVADAVVCSGNQLSVKVSVLEEGPRN